MRHLGTLTHESVKLQSDLSQFTRSSTRAIVTREQKLLLLHTKRYDDYSLPGGGLDENEDPIAGLKRELCEETGAQNIRNVQPFGKLEEYRPWYKPEYDVVHMISYCYTCEIDDALGSPKLEAYEISNGMSAGWVDIDIAIAHNQNTLENSERKGLSIEREIYLLKMIKSEILGVRGESQKGKNQ